LSSPSRRTFLAQSSLAVAGTLLGARQLRAGMPVELPLDASLPVGAYLPPSLEASDFRALATAAVDAAKSAGASYADIRIAERNWMIAEDRRVVLETTCTYGVRALVDGKWGFSYGRAPTPEAVVQCAHEAVSSGRLSAQLSARTRASGAERNVPEWTPAPAATGEWRTPIEIDPFQVPVQEHSEFAHALAMVASRLPGVDGGLEVQWIRETRTFASTVGSLLTQYLCRCLPMSVQNMTAHFGGNRVNFCVDGIRWTSGGYEVLRKPGWMDRFQQASEDAVWLSRLPMRPTDVGRYPVVFDGTVTGALLGVIIGPSLELDRVLGFESEASGTSRFTPELLGTAISSPLVTVTGNRAMPSVSAVKWDDDGNEPQEHTLIRDGVLTDYHTNGQTVGALKSWYDRQGKPLRSNGCAVAPEALHAVTVQPPELSMAPNRSTTSLQDLYKGMKRGIAVLNTGWIAPDQQLTSGSISSWDGVYEVSNGKIVRRLVGMGLEFSTVPFIKNIVAVGDQSTVRHQDISTSKGMPWVDVRHGADAPAVLFKDINVISQQS